MSSMHQADGYKTGHKAQYPVGTEWILDNFTPRSAKLFQSLPGFDNKIVWFGPQAFIMEFLIKDFNENFFNRPIEEVVSKYVRRMNNYLGPKKVTGEHIAALHDLGYLPITIKSLPEGSRVNIGVPPMVWNPTLPEFGWVGSYLETVMSCELWKPSTVATIAYEYKRMLTKYAVDTGGDASFVSLQGHDFSFRGMSCRQDAAKCGAGHLLSFIGTDTIPAIDFLEDYYGADSDKEMIGCSVPATEHSVICLGGKESEIKTIRRLIKEVYPTGIISIVSDTWNFWDIVKRGGIIEQLKPEILARQPDAWGLNKVVIRPDSGDPVKIVCGLKVVSYKQVEEDWLFDDDMDPSVTFDVIEKDGKYYRFETDYSHDYYGGGRENRTLTLKEEVTEAEIKGAIECLWDIFGGTVTEKGFKQLHPQIGLIYGDSITLQRCKAILEGLMAKGFASTNIVFGIGSYTYQYITRDTFGWAVKATAGVINGELVEVQKDPITDKGSKKSACGLLRVEKEGNDYVLHQNQTWEQFNSGALKTVFENGKQFNMQTLAEIRQRLTDGG